MPEKWTAKELRKRMVPAEDSVADTEPQPCFICGKHVHITEEHHVIPLKEIAKFLNLGIITIDVVEIPIVWLCPNCHSYIHECMSKNLGCTTAVEWMKSEDYKEGFIIRVCKILKMRDDFYKKILKNQMKEIYNFKTTTGEDRTETN